MATTYLHGTTRTAWTPHIGACLTDDMDGAVASAAIHGGDVTVYSVTIDMTGLTVEDRTSEVRRDDGHYPGDTKKDITRLAAEGVDIVTYDDETEDGSYLICVRIVSERALAAAKVVVGQ